MRAYLFGSTGRDQPTDTFDHSKKSANAKTKTYVFRAKNLRMRD